MVVMNKKTAYVVSWTCTSGYPSGLSDGVVNVYSSLELAKYNVHKAILEMEDKIYDDDSDIAQWNVYTEKGTWRIERFEMDDEM